MLEVVPRLLITGRRVAGSSFGGVKGRTQVPQYVDRWLRGEIDVESLISHRLTLDEVNRGFELMEAQDGIRSVIDVHVTVVLGILLSAGRARQRGGGDRRVRLGGPEGRRGGPRRPGAHGDPSEDAHRPLDG